MIIHGKEDRIIPFRQSLAFTQALDTAGVDNQLLALEGMGHICYPKKPIKVMKHIWHEKGLVSKKIKNFIDRRS